jgi:hypothetical protein
MVGLRVLVAVDLFLSLSPTHTHTLCNLFRFFSLTAFERNTSQDALELQQRVPTCLQELEVLDTSLRLAERKMRQADKLMQEAELETKRLQHIILSLNLALTKDEEERIMQYDYRDALVQELAVTEVRTRRNSRSRSSSSSGLILGLLNDTCVLSAPLLPSDSSQQPNPKPRWNMPSGQLPLKVAGRRRRV